MTCQEVRKLLEERFDAAIPQPETECVREHLAACEECASEYAGFQAAMTFIQHPVPVQASPDLKERIMSRIADPETAAGRRFFFPRWILAAAAAGLALLLAPQLANIGRRQGNGSGAVLSLMAQSIQAMSNLQSVHLSARMRTTPRENFEHIDPSLDWVPIEMWKECGPPARWRVEKPERVAVMDGTASLLLIKPGQAFRGTPEANFVEWLKVLLDPDQVIDLEMRAAREHAGSATLTGETRNGVRQLVLVIQRTAEGDFRNDWLRNKSVSSSDHTRIYRFDPVTKRLESMQLVLHAKGQDTPVFEITAIRYNEAPDPQLFTLALPPDVIWGVDPRNMPAAASLPKSPREAAVLFFEALAREDWQRALLVYPQSGFSDDFRKAFGGIDVISIGEPFQSGLYRGWFVPYRIKLKSGGVKTHNLAVRNDNPAGRWVFDGGL